MEKVVVVDQKGGSAVDGNLIERVQVGSCRLGRGMMENETVSEQ